MSGLKTFKRGCIWRIGDGATIDIWSDQWVPSSPTRKILTPRGQVLLSKVSELIDPVTGNRDEQLISDNFRHGDVERILQIPLPNHGQPGFIAWQFNKSGCFSVKSAYHAEWNAEYRRRAQRGDGSDRASPHEVWKKI